MSIYDLPKFNFPNFLKNKTFWFKVLIIFIFSVFGFLVGALVVYFVLAPVITGEVTVTTIEKTPSIINETPIITGEAIDFLIAQEEVVIRVIERVSPAIVSVVATRYLPVISPWQEFFILPPRRDQGEIERKEVGWGSGFIISEDGLILTNRHVVADERADYSVILNDGREFRVEVLARDRVLDLAILKIEIEEALPVVELGDSANLRLGQTVIAIGNVLGEFQNSVSVGVVAGLGRTVTARGGGLVMTLEDVIQADAAINPGNSGGPLLNLKGQVVGINTAMVVGAENIGFAIPVNQVKEAIEEIKEYGRILHPFLGVRWLSITERIQREYDLPVDYGVLIIRGGWGEPAVFPSSAAEKAGLRENDIILEFNQKKITPENHLGRIIVRYNPGDEISLKILRDGQEKTIKVILSERVK